MDITVRHAGGTKVVAVVKDHKVVTDQPVSQGGEASAPAPFDLFMASIATCAGYYVYGFCHNREIPVDDIELVMRTEKNRQTKMITSIEIEVRLPDAFPRKYEQAIIRSVDLCTVKRHLIEPPEIKTVTVYS